MIMYMVEWQNYEDIGCDGNYIIENQEFYTKKEVAEERAKRLDYEFTHIFDDDEGKVRELSEMERWEQDWNYVFKVTEQKLQEIEIKDLPGIEI